FAGVDIAVVTDSAELDSLDAQGLSAETPFDRHRHQVRFGPAAFASWDTLAKTIAHQHRRAGQLRAGRPPGLAPRPEDEADASRPGPTSPTANRRSPPLPRATGGLPGPARSSPPTRIQAGPRPRRSPPRPNAPPRSRRDCPRFARTRRN